MESCAACGKIDAGLKACAACMLVKYCNANCQIAHWPKHKKNCRIDSTKESKVKAATTAEDTKVEG